jgi:cobalamin biosynthesis Mg chelatase CobN
LIDNFIIPANLTTGMEFNSNMGNMGKMMIGDSRQGSYCGATRTVVTTTYGGNTYTWDRATGVSVEGNSEGTLNGQAYTMHSLATATNMWQTETAATPDNMLIYIAIIVVAIIVVVAVVAVFALRRGKK